MKNPTDRDNRYIPQDGVPLTEEDHILGQAADIVKTGGVVIVVTETFYALAASPFNEDAIRRIFRIKGRAESKPLPLIASDRLLVEEIAGDIPEFSRALMDRFWPGSLTILLQPTRSMSPLVAGPGGKIGVRVPPACPARFVAARSGGWITATSANLSGEPDPSTVSEISHKVAELVDLIVDSGPAPGGRPSTLVEPLEDDARVLREGAVPKSEIAAFVAEWKRFNRPR